MSILKTTAYFQDPIIVQNFNDLFSLYERLIHPVQEFEAAADHKARLENELREAQNTISSAWLMPLFRGFTYTMFLAIPFIILYLIIGNVMTNSEGVKWIYIFDNWLGKLWIMEKFGELTDLVPVTFLTSIIVIPLFLFVGFCVAPTVIILFPTMVILGIFLTILSVIKAKSAILRKKQEIMNLEEELNFRLDDLSLPLSLVPPSYRNSDALAYFCYCYQNGKANTLQEAVNAYDAYCHQQRVEQAQQQIMYKQEDILKNIQYQTAKISSLNDKVDRLKRKVDWL